MRVPCVDHEKDPSQSRGRSDIVLFSLSQTETTGASAQWTELDKFFKPSIRLCALTGDLDLQRQPTTHARLAIKWRKHPLFADHCAVDSLHLKCAFSPLFRGT